MDFSSVDYYHIIFTTEILDDTCTYFSTLNLICQAHPTNQPTRVKSQWNGFIQTHFMYHVIYIYPTNRHRCTQTAPITIQWSLYQNNGTHQWWNDTPVPYKHLWCYTLSTVSLWSPRQQFLLSIIINIYTLPTNTNVQYGKLFTRTQFQYNNASQCHDFAD